MLITCKESVEFIDHGYQAAPMADKWGAYHQFEFNGGKYEFCYPKIHGYAGKQFGVLFKWDDLKGMIRQGSFEDAVIAMDYVKKGGC